MDSGKNMDEFRKDLACVINSHSRENGSGTPDFILAAYLTRCLEAFDLAVGARNNWYGVESAEVVPCTRPSKH